MNKRANRYCLPAGVFLFALCLFGLVAIFVNDWIVTHKPPVVVKEFPEPPAEPVPEPPPAPAAPQPALKEDLKPVTEQPAKPEEQPEPLPAPKPPEEDPWVAEKERLQNRPRGRGGVVVQVNPRIMMNGQGFAFGGPGVFQHPLGVPEIRGFAPPPMIDPEAFAEEFLHDVNTRRVAMAARTLIFNTLPEARHFVGGFGLGKGDRRLVVYVRDAFLEFDDARRRTVMEGIATVWRESNQLRQHRCSKTVEFRADGGWKDTLEP
jgi:hypothetical protein